MGFGLRAVGLGRVPPSCRTHLECDRLTALSFSESWTYRVEEPIINLRSICVALLSVLAPGIFATAAVWAQDAASGAATSSSRGGSAWMLSYAIVTLALLLGVYVVCRPLRKSDADE